MKLNTEQSKHLAASLRAYGLGQLVAFGYTGIQSNEWFTVITSFMAMFICEIGSLLVLKN